MNESKAKLVIGFITYGESTAKYLPYFLPSLQAQTFKDYKIVVIDNTEIEQNKNLEYIKNNYPEIDFAWAGENLGFARAYNRMIKRAVDLGAEYFLALNADMLLLPETIEKILTAIDKDLVLGSVSPKIFKWDFENKQTTDIIDTCGIIVKPSLQFFDLGQGEKDEGQFNQSAILGPSGAASLFRLSALEKIKEGRQYFDEHFFMYKEDCDLAMRLNLKNYKSKLVPGAIIYHDRTVFGQGESILERIKSRQSKSRQVKVWSFLNQQLLYCKYWMTLGVKDGFRLIWQQCLLLGYIIILEPYLLLKLVKLAKIRRGLAYYK